MSRIFVAPIIGQSAASGAQVIDGSLKFDQNSKNYLTRTPSSAGNRKLWTWSSWLKFSDDGNQHIFTCNTSEPRNYIELYNRQIIVGGADYDASGSYFGVQTPGVLRDTGWYHVVVVMDTDQSAAGDRVKIYINGVLNVEASGDGNIGQGDQPQWNNTGIHYLGWNGTGSTWFNGQMSQCYLIDGQALGPEYFGFTDGLTNTWKPKKYVNTTASPGDAAGVVGFGTNGFYLPMDGSVPIGKDISGQGNDWTPKYFGGSLELDNPNVSGARPILNTTQGGAQAGIGVFGSKENKTYTVTYADDGGGNKYYIDGVKQATLTGLIRGATYTFNTVALGATHPFRLSATSAHGTEYTNGVKAVTGAATTITIPHNSPDTLYYYCTAHSGMGSSITGITTNEKLADRYASNCVLALPLVGSAGDTSASIACTMSNKAATISGAAADSTESNFYNGSFVFDGSNDELSYSASSDFDFGGGDFTIETWINMDTISAGQAILEYDGQASASSPDGQWYFSTSSGWVWFHNSTNYATIAKAKLPLNKWIHLALVRKGNVLTHYLNGVCEASEAYTQTDAGSSSRALVIGQQNDSSYFDGHLQDYRIYKGVAKYVGVTTDVQYFVPPSRSPDILPDTPSGVANSSKLTKVTEGAIALDGTGDYLSLADSADFDFGTGDYTAEAFIYAKSYADMYVINQTTDHGGAAPWWGLNFWSNGSSFTIRAGRTDSSGNAKHEFSFPWAINKWYHFAVSRSSGTSRCYLDGVLLNTQSDTDDIDGNGTLYIGAYNNGGLNWNGFISNVRIVKGTGLYTEPRITPPTAPLTNVTNTKLLCCQSTTDRTAAVVKPGSITGNGNAAATNFNPFNIDINTVRGQETGYATLNPLANYGITLANGNLDWQGGTNQRYCRPTLFADSGKWYCEFHMRSTSHIPGIIREDHKDAAGILGELASSRFQNNGTIGYSGGDTVSGGTTWAAGDCVQLFMDMDNRAIYWGVNGIMKIGDDGNSGDPLSGTNRTGAVIYPGVDGLTDRISEKAWGPAVGTPSANDTGVYSSVNFGQKPFKYAPPEGYQPWNIANIRPETVFSRPDQYVGISTWTGTGGLGTKVISHNFKFKPDFIWAKERNGGSSHALFDSVRGYGSNNVLCSNNKNPAGTSNGGYINSVSTSTITWAQGSSTGEFYDLSNKNYVAWCWRAGGDKNTFNKDDEGFASAAAAGLTAGTITPVGSSVGTKQGFSIIQYQGNGSSGAQVPHGLTQTPDFTIIRAIDDVTDDSWFVAGNWAPGYGRLLLHTGDADNGSPGNTVANELWNNTAPTSSVVTLGSYNGVNDSGDDFIMFNWHNVPGLQKFGTYTGNSSVNFVELGFRPALIILKNQSNSSYTSYTYFAMFDSARDTSNTMQNVIFAGKSQEENKRGNGSSMSSVADFSLDFLSNGFALRDNGASEINLNTNTYVYAAWAEAPSFDLYGGGANAR